jgi:hypothetical protein
MAWVDVCQMERYMNEPRRWNLIEGVFNRIPIAYPILSLVAAILIFCAYFAFMFIIEIDDFQYDPYFGLSVLFSSMFIAYLLAGNQYILDKIRYSLQKLKYTHSEEKYAEELYAILESNFTKSNGFYPLMILVIVPFILKDLVQIYVLESSAYEDLFFSSWILNIYNYTVFLFSLYLLTNMVWIILNLSRFLKVMAREPYVGVIEVDLFNADKIGGLGEIRNLIINIIVYYSTGISLAVLAFVNPSGFEAVYFEIAFLISLLAAGIIILISGLQELQKLFRRKMCEELSEINEKYRRLYERLVEVASVENNDKKEDELNFISTSIELLDKERLKRESLLEENEKKYNFAVAFVAINSSAMTMFTLYEKLNNFGIISFILDEFNIGHKLL